MRKHFTINIVFVLILLSCTEDVKISGNVFIEYEGTNRLIDETGKIIETDYDGIFYGNEFVYVTKKKGKYGLINRKGEIIKKPVFDSITGISQMYLWQNNKALMLDSFKLIEIKVGEYLSISELSNGFTKYKENGKWGIIDNKGNRKVEALYDNIFITAHSKNLFCIEDKYRGRVGLINQDGNMITPIEYSINKVSFGETIVSLIDSLGNVLTPLGDYILHFSNTNSFVYDFKNNTNAKFQYINYQILDDSLLQVTKDYKSYKIFNIATNQEFYIDWDWISPIYNVCFNRIEKEKFFRIVKNGFYGIYHTEFGVLTEPKYDFIEDILINGKIKVIKDKKMGVISIVTRTHPLLNTTKYTEAIELIKPEYDYIDGYTTRSGIPLDYTICQNKGKYGLLDLDGNRIIPVIFDSIYVYEDSNIWIFDNLYIAVKKYGRWALIAKYRNEIFSSYYESLQEIPVGDYIFWEYVFKYPFTR